jgi:hypothetical protein
MITVWASFTFPAAEKGSNYMSWENAERFNEVVKDFVRAK